MEKKDLHITFLLAAFSVGGAQSVMVNLANNLANKGIKIDFLVADNSGPFSNKLDTRVNLIDLKTKRISRSLFAVTKYLKVVKPNILFCTQKHTNILACISKMLSRTPIKLVLRESSTPSVQYLNSTKKEKFIYQIAKLFYPIADYFIGQSIGLTNDCISFYRIPKNKIKSIVNPIISKKIFELSKETCDHPWINSNTPILISIGRICVAKDFETLIRAFSIVRKKKNCKLIILGNIEPKEIHLFERLKKLISQLGLEQEISFPGFQQNPFSYLTNTNVYVLSSVYEGLPGALIQAMALGCNVVSTDCPNGPREIISRGESGILVPVKDYEGLAKGILHHLSNPHIPKYDLSIYEEENATQEYLNTFNALCAY